MKKQLTGLCVAVMLALTSAPSFATFGHHNPKPIIGIICKILPFLCVKPPVVTPPVKPPVTPPVKPPVKPPVVAVPEIDAANAGLALALVGGLVAIRRERRNRG